MNWFWSSQPPPCHVTTPGARIANGHGRRRGRRPPGPASGSTLSVTPTPSPRRGRLGRLGRRGIARPARRPGASAASARRRGRAERGGARIHRPSANVRPVSPDRDGMSHSPPRHPPDAASFAAAGDDRLTNTNHVFVSGESSMRHNPHRHDRHSRDRPRPRAHGHRHEPRAAAARSAGSARGSPSAPTVGQRHGDLAAARFPRRHRPVSLRRSRCVRPGCSPRSIVDRGPGELPPFLVQRQGTTGVIERATEFLGDIPRIAGKCSGSHRVGLRESIRLEPRVPGVGSVGVGGFTPRATRRIISDRQREIVAKAQRGNASAHIASQSPRGPRAGRARRRVEPGER